MTTPPVSQGRANQLTGRLGQHAAEGLLLRMGLTPRPETWDEGEDYSIEVPLEGGGWERMYVQVKGTQAGFRTTGDGAWSVALEARAVERYRAAAHPVVLLAVDVRADEIRWDDLSGLADRTGDVAVKVAPSARLTLAMADDWIATLRELLRARRAERTSPTDTIAATEARLRALDDRLDVRVTADREGVTCHLSAKGTAPVEIAFGGTPTDDGAVQWDALFTYGTPAVVDFNNFVIAGSPVFDHDGDVSEARLIVRTVPQDVVVALGWFDEQANFQGGMEGRASLYIGEEGFELRLNDPGLPLQVTLRNRMRERKLHGTFGNDSAAWDGHTLANLPWWDRYWSLLQALAAGARLGIARREFGEFTTPVSLGTSDQVVAFAKAAIEGLGPIPTAVELAKRGASQIRWTHGATLSIDEVADLRAAERLLRGEAVEVQPSRLPYQPATEDPHGTAIVRARLGGEFRLGLMGEALCRLEVIWRLYDYVLERPTPSSPSSRPRPAAAV